MLALPRLEETRPRQASLIAAHRWARVRTTCIVNPYYRQTVKGRLHHRPAAETITMASLELGMAVGDVHIARHFRRMATYHLKTSLRQWHIPAYHSPTTILPLLLIQRFRTISSGRQCFHFQAWIHDRLSQTGIQARQSFPASIFRCKAPASTAGNAPEPSGHPTTSPPDPALTLQHHQGRIGPTRCVRRGLPVSQHDFTSSVRSSWAPGSTPRPAHWWAARSR